MHIIVCVDNNSGMMFGGRRQSRDSILLEDVFSCLSDTGVAVFPYSENLFTGYENVKTAESFDEVGERAVFVEEPSRLDGIAADKITVYCWNRDYPADEFFTFDLSCFEISEISAFAGNSHEKITKTVYVKKNV